MRKNVHFVRSILLGTAIYISLGCILTPRRSILVTEPGVTTVGVSYGRGFDLDTYIPGHLSLITADFRRSGGKTSTGASAGLYFCKVVAGGKQATKKLVILK